MKKPKHFKFLKWKKKIKFKIIIIVVRIAKIDKTHLEVILGNAAEKIKLIDSLKTDEKYSEIYTNQIISKLALNVANKTEQEDTEVKFDTSGVGDLIKANCTLKFST